MNLRDLLRQGLLKPGDNLIWPQPRLGLLHKAAVHGDGHLVTPDGKVHKSPSGAARHFYGKPIDGWVAWQVESTGKRLTELRKIAQDNA